MLFKKTVSSLFSERRKVKTVKKLKTVKKVEKVVSECIRGKYVRLEVNT